MKFGTVTEKVIGCAIEVHKELGPGLLENTYKQCLSYELTSKGIRHQVEKGLPVFYKGLDVECGYRIDIFVEDVLIVELKSVSKLLQIHKAQLLTYMKLAKVSTGLLINFNEFLLRNGIRRMVL